MLHEITDELRTLGWHAVLYGPEIHLALPVLYLVVAFALTAFGGWALHAALYPLVAYLAIVAVATFSLRPHVWALTALGVVSSHICYGVQFVRGFLASKAPCEFIGKDHA